MAPEARGIASSEAPALGHADRRYREGLQGTGGIILGIALPWYINTIQ
jgi:hypothetical protein